MWKTTLFLEDGYFFTPDPFLKNQTFLLCFCGHTCVHIEYSLPWPLGHLQLEGVAILQENLNYSPALCVIYKILLQILPQLQKLQVHFNQGCGSVFDMGGEWFCVVHRGVSEGDVPLLRSWKILYFWNWNRAIWWVLLGANLQQVMMSKKTVL